MATAASLLPNKPSVTLQESHDPLKQEGISSYLLVPKGYGGTFTLGQPTSGITESGNPSPTRLSHIGTLGCFTTVGVYFAIDAHRCFAAHIDAHIRHARHGVLIDQRARGEEIRQELVLIIHDALEREGVESGWVESDAWFGQNVVVACERLTDDEVVGMHREHDDCRDPGEGHEGDVLVSEVVAEAVLGWLEGKRKKKHGLSRRDDVESLETAFSAALEVEKRYGFVVQHGGDGMKLVERGAAG